MKVFHHTIHIFASCESLFHHKFFDSYEIVSKIPIFALCENLFQQLSLAHQYESIGRAIAVTTASVSASALVEIKVSCVHPLELPH